MLNKQILIDWGVKVAFARILKLEDLKYLCCPLWITWYPTPGQNLSFLIFYHASTPITDMYKYAYFMLLFLWGKTSEKGCPILFLLRLLDLFCLPLYFPYSHYLWALFFVSCSGRVFWAVYLISRFTIHPVLRSATILVTFSTTISLWK